jgi:hypothetical protein
MVEMDEMTRETALRKKKKKGSDSVENGNSTRKGKSKYSPTYVKSNSLGLLAVADAHDYFGSSVLHWEGGDEGERKIQKVKPKITGIRRKNAQWTRLAIEKIYTEDTIDWLLGRIPQPKNSVGVSGNSSLYHLYKSKDSAMAAVEKKNPLAVYQMDDKLYLIYKPVRQDDNTRSSAAFIEVILDDTTGIFRLGCWFANLTVRNTSIVTQNHVVHIKDLTKMVTKNILALPLMAQDETDIDVFHRREKYYLTSDDWDERIGDGNFIKSHVTDALFQAWY